MGIFKRLFGGGEDSPERDRDREKALRAGRPPLERPLPAFPFPIEACHGEEALLRLARLREQGRRDGFTALVIGDDDDVESLAELPQFNQVTPEEYLRLAESIDVAAWFEERRSEEPEAFEVGLGESQATSIDRRACGCHDWAAKAARVSDTPGHRAILEGACSIAARQLE